MHWAGRASLTCAVVLLVTPGALGLGTATTRAPLQHRPMTTPGALPMVRSTIDLALGTRAAGNSVPPSIAYPAGLALVPPLRRVYVAEPSLGRVVYFSDLTNLTLGSIRLGGTPSSLVFDNRTGELFVADSASSRVSVLSTALSRVVATVPVGVDPAGLAYDYRRGEVFVANSGSNNISVISDVTDRVVATVPTLAAPTSLAYVGPRGEVYAADTGANNLSIVSDATNRVLGNISLNGSPTSLVYDAGAGKLFVAVTVAANGFQGQIEVVAPGTRKVVATVFPVPALHGFGRPVYVAYDPIHAQVLAVGDNINATFIADSSLTVTSNLYFCENVASAAGLAFDRRTATFFESCNNSRPYPPFPEGEVGELSAATTVPLVTIPQDGANGRTPGPAFPLADAFDVGRNRLYVADSAANAVRVWNVSAASMMPAIAVGNDPEAVAYDPVHEQIFVANVGSANVSVISDRANTVVATIRVGLDPVALADDSVHGRIFVVNEQSSNVSVVSTASDRVIKTLTYGTTLQYSGGSSLVYDPLKGAVFVGLNGWPGPAVEAIGVTNGTPFAVYWQTGYISNLAFDRSSRTLYVGLWGSSNEVQPINTSTGKFLGPIPAGAIPLGLLVDARAGELLVSNSNDNNVSIVSTANGSLVATLPVGLFPSALAWDGPRQAFVVNAVSDTVTVVRV